MNLLIVNDEIRTAEVMKREIEWEKYGIREVYTAYDAERGKTILQENEIDIILCDIEMPGENGLSLLKWIRGQGYDIECIFLTCHANFAYAQEAISLGCQDYILVPAKYEDIGQAIYKVVKRIEGRRSDDHYREYGKAFLQEQVKKKEEDRERKMSPEELAAEVKTYIMEHLGDSKLSVNNIAEKFFFHPVYLNRIFKQKEGASVSQFIINKRMKLAASLLMLGDLSGTEVAVQVGYAYYTNFHNMFKRFYGCTPLQYQEEHKGNASAHINN